MAVSLIVALVIALSVFGCTEAPVQPGRVLGILKTAPMKPGHSTLVVKWFGTASYEISLGDVAVLTDPFVTYKGLGDVLSVSRPSNHMRSKPELVKRTYGSMIRPPTAIFVGHSHYDHMMDTVAALELSDEWGKVRVYGGQATGAILHGYPKCTRGQPCGNRSEGSWADNFEKVHPGQWGKTESPSLRYLSIEGTHAPHFLGITLWDDEEIENLKTPPKIAADFQAGRTYIHFFEFTTKRGKRRFTVGLVGAATRVSNKLKEFGADLEELDILILCVPGWDKVEDDPPYPKNLLAILKPKMIILSHYDNFFEPDRNARPVMVVPGADFPGFLERLKEQIRELEQDHGYGEFQGVLIPGVGTSIYFKKSNGHDLELVCAPRTCPEMDW